MIEPKNITAGHGYVNYQTRSATGVVRLVHTIRRAPGAEGAPSKTDKRVYWSQHDRETGRVMTADYTAREEFARWADLEIAAEEVDWIMAHYASAQDASPHTPPAKNPYFTMLTADDLQVGGAYVCSRQQQVRVVDSEDETTGRVSWTGYALDNGQPVDGDFCTWGTLLKWADRRATPDEIQRLQHTQRRPDPALDKLAAALRAAFTDTPEDPPQATD